MDTPTWIPVAERLPRDDETLDGRVPAIDEDGVMVTALLAGDTLIGNGIPLEYWLPVPPLRRAH